MKVYNDLLLAPDNGDVSALCLLDLTAAFDTVDNDMMMLKLERQFGLRGVVLDWFRSYLCGRTYRVIHGGVRACVRACVRVCVCVCVLSQGYVLRGRESVSCN